MREKRESRERERDIRRKRESREREMRGKRGSREREIREGRESARERARERERERERESCTGLLNKCSSSFACGGGDLVPASLAPAIDARHCLYKDEL